MDTQMRTLRQRRGKRRQSAKPPQSVGQNSLPGVMYMAKALEKSGLRLLRGMKTPPWPLHNPSTLLHNPSTSPQNPSTFLHNPSKIPHNHCLSAFISPGVE